MVNEDFDDEETDVSETKYRLVFDMGLSTVGRENEALQANNSECELHKEIQSERCPGELVINEDLHEEETEKHQESKKKSAALQSKSKKSANRGENNKKVAVECLSDIIMTTSSLTKKNKNKEAAVKKEKKEPKTKKIRTEDTSPKKRSKTVKNKKKTTASDAVLSSSLPIDLSISSSKAKRSTSMPGHQGNPRFSPNMLSTVSSSSQALSLLTCALQENGKQSSIIFGNDSSCKGRLVVDEDFDDEKADQQQQESNKKLSASQNKKLVKANRGKNNKKVTVECLTDIIMTAVTSSLTKKTKNKEAAAKKEKKEPKNKKIKTASDDSSPKKSIKKKKTVSDAVLSSSSFPIDLSVSSSKAKQSTSLSGHLGQHLSLPIMLCSPTSISSSSQALSFFTSSLQEKGRQLISIAFNFTYSCPKLSVDSKCCPEHDSLVWNMRGNDKTRDDISCTSH